MPALLARYKDPHFMLWMKAFHIIAVVTWFAGLFYLPRLFVYHAQMGADEPITSIQRFCTMERRLYWGIMTPSAVVTLLLGTGLVHMMGWSFSAPPPWLFWKLALVAILVLYHLQCGYYLVQFKRQQNRRSHVFFRWFNEVPSVILVVTVLLVVLKPA